jgi:hypothetical protein
MLRCGDVLCVVVGGCESRGVKKCVAGEVGVLVRARGGCCSYP